MSKPDNFLDIFGCAVTSNIKKLAIDILGRDCNVKIKINGSNGWLPAEQFNDPWLHLEIELNFLKERIDS